LCARLGLCPQVVVRAVPSAEARGEVIVLDRDARLLVR
jgi:hypothetical protein